MLYYLRLELEEPKAESGPWGAKLDRLDYFDSVAEVFATDLEIPAAFGSFYH